MSANLALMLLLASPFVQAALLALLSRPPGLRDVVHIGFSFAQLGFAISVLVHVAHGGRPELVLAHPLPDVDLKFVGEPLGALVGAVMAGLGALQSVYTAGYVRATRLKSPVRLMAYNALTLTAALAVAFSANLFTMFVAYQAVALAACPLIGDRGEDEGKGVRVFLASVLGPSLGLFLPAMVWAYSIAGPADFRVGGILEGFIDPLTANVLLGLFVLGAAMSTMPPFGGWLNATSGSSFPALISIQAVAVLPAGSIVIVKIAAYVFGTALRDASIAAQALLALAGAGMCAASVFALSKQDIRERLAYSCMAQALAAIVGALLAFAAGLFAATLQIVAASLAAATLVMAAGAASAVAGKESARDYSGLGRSMPWTFAAFAIASASMVGMPPFAGAWAKLWLIAAAAGAGLLWAAALVGVAAMFTFAHLGPLAANALAAQASTDALRRPDGASFMLAAPAVVAAAATLGLLVLANPLAVFLSPVWTPTP